MCHTQLHGHAHELKYIDTMAGILAIADALHINASLTWLNVSFNHILGEEGEAALRKAIEGRSGFELLL